MASWLPIRAWTRPPALGRLLLQGHEEVHHFAGFAAAVHDVAGLDEVGLPPIQRPLSSIRPRAEHGNEAGIVAVDVADGDHPFDARPFPIGGGRGEGQRAEDDEDGGQAMHWGIPLLRRSITTKRRVR